ncbi:hypothetical protein Tco_0190651 [Tanacetum coccineum]
MHKKKVQQEKLKAVKARLNFEETSQYSESGAPSRRRDVGKRLGPKGARSMSRSPEPRRNRSRSPRRKDPERETVFRRLEKGVFHGLGDKEKGMSAYSSSLRRQSHHSSRGRHESYYQVFRSRGRSPLHKMYHDRKANSRKCEETDPFTPRIRYSDLPKRIRMPSHVKTYDGSEDPEDHLKIFQAAVKSIYSYDDLKKAFLANYLQQKKCIKDPSKLINIKQREGSLLEEYCTENQDVRSRDVKGRQKS